MVELLVVIVIILVLVGLLLPAISTAMKKARWMQARTAVKSLENAFNAYFYEYACWPTNMTDTSYDTGWNVEATAKGVEVEKKLVSLLQGQDVLGLNPKRIAFMTNIEENLSKNINAMGQYCDPGARPYKYMLDYNYDNTVHIEFPGGGKLDLKRPVAVWSRGPDGKDEPKFQRDDVRSW